MPDITDTLKSGDVIKISNFDLPRIGNEIKNIWGIYLGIDGIFDCPVFIYFCRTTTQEKDFGPGGNRASHKYIKFISGQYGFEDDCLIDLNERPFTDITKEKFTSFTIEKKGYLPDSIIQEIWDLCLKKYLNTPQKKSIKDSFLKANINIRY